MAHCHPKIGDGPFMSEAETLTIIEAGRAERHYWRDMWRYRELLYFLARRDVSVRYKQTVIGIAWAVIRPLATMLIFTLVFGRIANLPSEGVPYSLLVFTGMLPWFFFSSALSESSSSLIANSNLLSKVFFPRLILPASAVIVALVDFAINFALLLMMMACFGYSPTLRILVLPLFIMLTFCTALGLGLWFSALNVKYRDFQLVIPFLLQFGLYVSPIGFSASVIPEKWRLLYSLNPMVGVIEAFRWAILGGNFIPRFEALFLSTTLACVLVASGLWFFRRTERSFADVI
jgi:lipopolysaccharide transport system permease protein